MKPNNSLIKKGDFFVHKKSFSNKFSLNKLGNNLTFHLFKTSEIPFIIGNSNTLNIKTSLYILSKLFKEHKRLNMNISSKFSLENLDRFSLKLQTSGFYNSIVETNKKKKLDKIHAKILEFYIYCFFKQYNKNNNGIVLNNLKKEYTAKEGYKNFYQKVKTSKLIQIRSHKNSLAILQKKYTRILESRVLLYLKTHKKKYNSTSKKVSLNKLKIKQLFDLFSKTKKNFKKEKKRFYNQYKKLVWKRKKRRNRKKTGLLHFLRRRRRMLYKYYVPRHLEINYKTFDIAHLGLFDSLTTNSRITFWLNLRRLMTFLSL